MFSEEHNLELCESTTLCHTVQLIYNQFILLDSLNMVNLTCQSQMSPQICHEWGTYEINK